MEESSVPRHERPGILSCLGVTRASKGVTDDIHAAGWLTPSGNYFTQCKLSDRGLPSCHPFVEEELYQYWLHHRSNLLCCLPKPII